MQKKSTPRPSTRRSGTKVALLIANFATLIGLGVFGGYYFTQYNELKNNPPTQEEVARIELESAVKGVSSLYGDLPTDEEPQLATVRDKEQLQDQEFFAKAENGDQALIYTKAELAILYRPSTNQIINVSTLSIQSEAPNITIIGQKEDRDSVEKTLQKAFEDQITITEKTNANNVYGSTIVVDVSGQNESAAEQIAEALDAEIGELPEGEDVPAGANILVVAGGR